MQVAQDVTRDDWCHTLLMLLAFQDMLVILLAFERFLTLLKLDDLLGLDIVLVKYFRAQFNQVFVNCCRVHSVLLSNELDLDDRRERQILLLDEASHLLLRLFVVHEAAIP